MPVESARQYTAEDLHPSSRRRQRCASHQRCRIVAKVQRGGRQHAARGQSGPAGRKTHHGEAEELLRVKVTAGWGRGGGKGKEELLRVQVAAGGGSGGGGGQ